MIISKRQLKAIIQLYYVRGIVGFYNNLTRLITRTKPEAVYVIWEGGGSKRKRDLYPEYKKGMAERANVSEKIKGVLLDHAQATQEKNTEKESR